jgi:hypothetical protein
VTDNALTREVDTASRGEHKQYAAAMVGLTPPMPLISPTTSRSGATSLSDGTTSIPSRATLRVPDRKISRLNGPTPHKF